MRTHRIAAIPGDGIGPELIERIGSKIRAVCISGENAPEMYLGKIAKESPDTILVVDAVHLGRKAGAIAIMDPEELSTPFFAALLGFLILRERVTVMQVSGMVLLFIGVCFLSRKEEVYF